jgi:hypothetical protein
VRRAALAAALFACASGPALAQQRVYHIRSKILGEERAIHVSVPPNYAVGKRRYQVTYLLDGHVKAFFDLAVAAAGYDLIGDPNDYAMPPQIVVGVEQVDRGTDLGRNQDAFSRFLADEVVPFVEHEFRTVPWRTLIGHSLGGRFALGSFCRTPGLFAAVIAISPGIGDSTGLAVVRDCLRRDWAQNTTVMHQLVLSAGDREERLRAGAAKLTEFLRDSAPPNFRWTFVDGTGLGHTETPFATIPRGIRFVHDRSVWEMPAALADSIRQGKLDPDHTIATWYRRLGARMGYDVPPSPKWLEVAAQQYLAKRDLSAAEAAAERLIGAYPDDLLGYGYLAETHLATNDVARARRALEDALRMLDRMEYFDEGERAKKKAVLRENLEKLPRG